MNLDWGIVWDSRHALLEGAGMTVLLTVATMALAVPGGIVLALMRLSSNRLASKAATVFVEFFRNLPLILVIYWAFYVMPMALDVQLALDDRAGGAGAEHLGLQLRDLPRRHQFHPQGPDGSGAGDGHVAAPGHVQGADPTGGAARAAGAGQHLGLAVKDTSLVSVIAVSELAYASMQIRAQSFRVLEMLTAMAAIYWLMGYPQAKLVDWIHRKYGVKE